MGGAAQQILRQVREDMEQCLSIMSGCRGREEILNGFAEAARLLRRSDPDHPMAEQAEWFLRKGASSGEVDLTRLQDDFVTECSHFLRGAEVAAG